MHIIFIILFSFLNLHSPHAYAIQLEKAKVNCAAVKPRREFRDLSREEWKKFVEAVKEIMKRKKSPEGLEVSLYDEFAKLDAKHSDEAKGYAPFLAYNRLQLRAFELALQSIDSDVMLPYWDWTLDAEHPEKSLLLSAEYMGGNGEGAQSCVATGPFANYQIQNPSGPTCLTRSYYPGPQIAPFADRKHIEKVVLKTKRYDQLRQFLVYAPTGSVFRGIGGQLMSSEPAQDPIYWLHMTYLDKLWSDWQKKDKKHQRSVGGMLRDSSIAKLSTPLPGTTLTIADVITTKDLCYTYSQAQTKAAAKP